MNRLKIALLNPFHTGSHKQWADNIELHSKHRVDCYTLKGRHWKWRMHAGALMLAQQLKEEEKPDLILTTDMLDVAQLKAHLPKAWRDTPIVLYMHENQLSYPWSETDEDPSKGRDVHYAFLNFNSACAADHICFNSSYHHADFMEQLPSFLQAFPDGNFSQELKSVQEKSEVVDLGFVPINKVEPRANRSIPRILWNHRWEYDKNPADFFDALRFVKKQGAAFELVALGEHYGKLPKPFSVAKEEFSQEIVHWGYAKGREEYEGWVNSCTILPVTSKQDFFGLSAIEAVHAGLTPLLPNRLGFTSWMKDKRAFYNTQKELEQKLLELVTNPSKQLNLSQTVDHLRWEKQIEVFDQEFERVAQQFS